MTVMTAVRTASLSAVLALTLVACEGSSLSEPLPPPVEGKPVAVVLVHTPATSLAVGAQVTLEAVPQAADGEVLNVPVTWSSQHQTFATVSDAGIVTGVAPGAATIVAAAGGKSGSVSLTVQQVDPPPPPPAPVAEVRLSVDEEVQLAWNGSAQLSAVALDADGNELPGRTFTWLSSRPDIFTVNAQGVLQAVSTGVATVTAVSDGVPASVAVRVLQAPVLEVLLDVGTTGLEVGETVFFGASLRLASGQVVTGPVTWTSNATPVATVNGSGLSLGAVQAVGVGTAAIFATAEGVTASVTLRVTLPPTHDLVYARSQGTQSEIFTLSLVGGGQPVRINAGNVSRDPSPSPDGTRIVFAVSQVDPFGTRQDDLFIVDRNGMNMRWLTRAAGLEDQPAWSPDGTRILFHGTDDTLGTADLWVINTDGTGLTNITAGLPAAVTGRRHPAWSPDGTQIVFTATQAGAHKVWIMNADGTNARPLTTDAGFDMTPTWSPDGTRVAFTRYDAATPANGWDVMIVPAAGGTPVRLSLPGDQLTPAWSPDGAYIAVAGTVVAGRSPVDLYTLRPDGTGLRLRTLSPAWGGGLAPAWITRQ